MRDYAKVAPQFWIGDTGILIRKLGSDAQIVAMYLMTCPASNMIGLYHISIPAISHDTGRSLEGTSEALNKLASIDFAHYDFEQEVVFMPMGAFYQIGTELGITDKRVKNVVKLMYEFRKCKFYLPFYEIYQKRYNLPDPIIEKPLPRALEAPPKPVAVAVAVTVAVAGTENTSVEDDVEDEQDTLFPGVDDEPFSPVLLTFPCKGDPKTWDLTEARATAFRAAYPTVDIEAEFKKALAWCQSNEQKQKKARGMPRFINGWLSGASQRRTQKSALQSGPKSESWAKAKQNHANGVF